MSEGTKECKAGIIQFHSQEEFEDAVMLVLEERLRIWVGLKGTAPAIGLFDIGIEKDINVAEITGIITGEWDD